MRRFTQLSAVIEFVPQKQKKENRVTELDRFFLKICLMSIEAIFGVKFSLSLLQLSEITFKEFVLSTHSYCMLTFIAHQIC